MQDDALAECRQQRASVKGESHCGWHAELDIHARFDCRVVEAPRLTP